MDNTKNRFSKTSKTLIALAISGLVACGGSETALDHLENAKRNHTENDLQSAIVELKNSLKKDAGSAEARALLGRIYSEKGLATDAEKELKKAIELGAPYNELALPLSSAMLMQGKADEVITEFAIRFSDREPTISIKSLALGESYFQKRDFKEAKKHLEAALENQETRPRALLGQALISVVENKLGEAQLLVEKALELDNNSLQAWMTQADIYRAKGEIEAAERAYIEVAERSNGRSGYFYKLAMRHLIRLQLQRNDLEAADSTLADLKKSFYKGQFPNDLELTLLRGYLAYAKQNYEASAELANKALLANNNLLGAKLVAGLSAARLDRLEQAESHLSSALSQDPENDVARKALATIQLRLKDTDKAVETLEPLHEKLDELDSPTLALLAKAAYSSGKAKRSSDYLRKALNLEPDNSQLSLLLAQSLSADSEYDQAISILKTIEKDPSNSEQSLLSQAQVHIKSMNYAAALDTLEQLQQKNPSNPVPASMKGTVYQLIGENEKAKSTFADILKSSPGFIPAIRSLAALELTDGQPERAEEIYKSALSQQPQNGAVLLDYGQLLAQQQRTDQAIEQFKAASKIQNYEIEGSVALARTYIANGQPEQAKAALVEHQGMDHSGVWAELGNAQMMSEEFASALKSYNRLANLEPTSSIPQYLIATAHMALGESRQAKSALGKSLEADGSFAPAISAYINLLISNEEIDEAKDRLKDLEIAAPQSANWDMLAGDIATKEKRYSAAAEHYGQAYHQAPSNSNRQRLVQALIKSEGMTSAINFLKGDTLNNPDTVHPWLLLANAYMNQNDTEAAIELYKATLNIKSDQPIALNNLAWLLKDRAPKEALIYAQRAHALKPDNQDIKETLEQIQQQIN